MLGKTVLLLARTSGEIRAIRSAVVATGSQVEVTEDRRVVARALDLDLVDCLVIVDPGVEELRSAYGNRSQAPVVLAYTQFSSEPLCDLPGEQGLTRVICSSDRPIETGRKIAIVVESLLCRNTDGVEKWMPGYGIDFWSFAITSSRERTDFVGCVSDYLEWVGTRARIADCILDAADELFTNAVYNAPRDCAGRSMYASLPRTRDILLEPRAHASARFGSDGERFAIAVRDPFGSFPWSRLSSRFNLCLCAAAVEDKAGGAGLGLFTTLKRAESIVINLDPGRSTEVIVIFSLRERPGSGCNLIWTVAPPPVQSVGVEPGYRQELQRQLFSSEPEPVVALSPRRVPRGTQVDGRAAPARPEMGAPRQARRAAGQAIRRSSSGEIAERPLAAFAPGLGRRPRYSGPD